MPRGLAGSLQRLMHFFLPKEEEFFELFAAMASDAQAAAELLRQLYEDGADPADLSARVGELEHRVDEVRHDSVKRLNDTFVTPIMFDRQDILDLGDKLDDVVDFIRAAVDRTMLYQVKRIPQTPRDLAAILAETTASLAELCGQLASLRSSNHPAITRINELENRGDRILKQGLADLFATETDPVEIIKWVEIYGYIEEAIDHCEDTASVIEAALVKNS